LENAAPRRPHNRLDWFLYADAVADESNAASGGAFRKSELARYGIRGQAVGQQCEEPEFLICQLRGRHA
jgi:hypothetical protein